MEKEARKEGKKGEDIKNGGMKGLGWGGGGGGRKKKSVLSGTKKKGKYFGCNA